MNFKDEFTFALNNHDGYCTFSSWIYLWKQILINWNISYFEINEFNYYFKNMKTTQISFSTNQFLNLGKYAWPYSLSNAELIIKKAKFHKNLHELLLNHPFDDALSLHKTHASLSEINCDYDEDFFLEFTISNSIFANSKLDRKDYFNSLKISNWTYSEVIISAICYCLQQIHIEIDELPEDPLFRNKNFSKQEMQELQKKSLVVELKSFFYKIVDYLLYFETSEVLFQVFQQINIISVYKLEFIYVLNKTFEKIDENDLTFREKYCKRNPLHKLTLFRILQALNLNVIFSEKLILTVVAWSTNRNYFNEIRNLLEVCKYFLDKFTLFEKNLDSTDFQQKKQDDLCIEKIHELFIIAFFQLQKIDDDGIKNQYGDLENKYFIKLVEFFHTMFPSFSVEKIYSITENQYLNLKKQEKRFKQKEKIKRIFNKFKYFGSVLLIVSASFTLVKPGRAHGIPPQAPGYAAEPISNLPRANRGRQLVPQAQANSQHQVLQKKTPAGQFHLTIGGNSKRAQLAQNHFQTSGVIVYQPTETEFFVSKGQKYIVVHGAGGNYSVVGKQKKYLTNYAKSIGAEIIQADTIVKAHLACAKVRRNCCVATDDGIAILSSARWNKAEEFGATLSRNLIYNTKYETIAFEEIMQTMHDDTRAEMRTKLNAFSNLSPQELLLEDITIEGHKEMASVSAKQLASYHLSLNVAPKEGYFLFLVRDTIAKIQELYVPPTSPIQTAMFNTPGMGSKQVLPGVAINESMEDLDKKYIIGMGICENISELQAKKMLQNELASVYYRGYAIATQAGQRFANLEKEQARGEVTGLPSFQPSSATMSPEPSTPEFATHLEQRRDMVLKKPPLAKDEALNKSIDLDIGDCRKSSKHEVRQIGERRDEEVFQNTFRQGRAQSSKANALKSYPISLNDSDA